MYGVAELNLASVIKLKVEAGFLAVVHWLNCKEPVVRCNLYVMSINPHSRARCFDQESFLFWKEKNFVIVSFHKVLEIS